MKIGSRLMILFVTAAMVLVYNLYGASTYERAVNSELCSEVKLPIVMYHAFLKDTSMHGKFVISPEQFEEDIKYILSSGYTPILVNELIAYTEGKGALPEKPIIITIDDGYYNNYLYAFPILQKYNAKAVISPIMKYSELYSQHDETNAYYTHITWWQGREMISSNLIEFQNHTYDLHSGDGKRKGIQIISGEPEAVYQKMLYSDLYTAHHLIKDNFGFAPTALTLPFGYYSKEAKRVIDEMGYKVTFSSSEGINVITSSPTQSLHMLKRFNRPHGKSSEEFFKNILE